MSDHRVLVDDHVGAFCQLGTLVPSTGQAHIVRSTMDRIHDHAPTNGFFACCVR